MFSTVKGCTKKGAGFSFLALLALDVAAVIALYVVVLDLVRRSRLTVELDQALAGNVDRVLAVVDADPPATKELGRLAGGARCP
jgi:hypothetical protein